MGVGPTVSDKSQIRRPRAALRLLDIELEALANCRLARKPGLFKRADVDKYVWTAIVLFQKTKSLVGLVDLQITDRHSSLSVLCVVKNIRQRGRATAS